MPLMTYEEYNKTQHDSPYILVIKAGDNFLYYFGESHSFDPKNPQWIKQKECWAEFLKSTAGTKRIVFTEGGVRIPLRTEEESIIKNGGMGLATFQAFQAGIPVHSPEPLEAVERLELEKKFSRDQIQYYYFARVVHQWGRYKEHKPDFEKYIEGYLRDDKAESGWADYDFSLGHMKKLHEEFFNEVFDPGSTGSFQRLTNPTRGNEEMIVQVATRSSQIRDEHIVREIKKYVDEGYSIFAQYGYSHVVIQEPLLREILSK